MEESEYNTIKSYLCSQVYPAFVEELDQSKKKEEKRKVRSKADHYTVQNDHLLHKKTSTIVAKET